MNNKWPLLIVLIIPLLLLAGCPGASDYDIDLSGKYTLLRGSAHDVTIQPKISEDNWDANPSKMVPAEVTEVGWNDKYIIAKQVKGENNYSFWIILVDSEKVIGPLNDVELIDKKEEYGIKNEITLKKVQDVVSEYYNN
ncbi:DUF3997 domain-containing protein [Sporosarcina sp. BI001-red]|uniref:DUF3997 domain-containing protein n=1 Tax=Sporosarcina sp. BI001-red TaxID=2282866 RepID=UPI000E260A8C|nr:DUF3997 domain-containing protein [Sporosarcina sp. BI001-red]REB11032.1 DUF3997 domain-containing protein [Sporosarcina sp. BI001-red]